MKKTDAFYYKFFSPCMFLFLNCTYSMSDIVISVQSFITMDDSVLSHHVLHS